MQHISTNSAKVLTNRTSKPSFGSRRTRLTALAIMLFISLAGTLAVVHAETYKYVTQWSGSGQDYNLDYAPIGIAADGNGNIYVVNSSYHCVREFDNNGVFIRQLGGTRGNNDGQFNQPIGIAVDSANNVYVVDRGNRRVQVFNSNGQFIKKWGQLGFTPGYFSGQISGIAVDNSGYVYVVDTYQNYVQKFTNDGVYINKFGSADYTQPGTANGQFWTPIDIAISKQGDIYVSDYNNHRIQRFDQNLQYVSQWGTYGSGQGKFYQPAGLAVDQDGNVYVAEYFYAYAHKYTADGTYIAEFTGPNFSNGKLVKPVDVAIDPNGFVFVKDVGNICVNKYRPSTNQLVQTSTGSGNALVKSGSGTLNGLTALTESSLPSTGKPAGVTFPDGLFSFTINDLTPGQTVTVTLQMPNNVPVGSLYWKYQASAGWFSLPIGDDDGDNIITLTLTDGGTGDSDGLANGVIVDPGGPGQATLFPLPESALGSLLVILMCTGAFVIVRHKGNRFVKH